jgi:hypothetical protein
MQVHEYKLDESVSLHHLSARLEGLDLEDLDLEDLYLARGNETDAELARNQAFELYRAALKSADNVPRQSREYLHTVERTVLLEARELLRGANLRATEWAKLPTKDEVGEFSKHLLVASGEFGEKKERNEHNERKERKSVLLLAHYDRESEDYTTQILCDDAEAVFASVNHRFAKRDLESSWAHWVRAGGDDFVCVSLGYIGDALATLTAVALIRLQGNHSPLLRAVAAPSKRVSAVWCNPTNEDGLNCGQLDALKGLAHNLEAISGPPGTGKSTIISALVRGCIPKGGGCTLVSAVQNRAIESIVQKMVSTAVETPFVVHGNEKRLSPTSLQWTVDAQAKRDIIYCNFLARKSKCEHMFEVLDKSLLAYKERVFPALFSSNSCHSRYREDLWHRLDKKFRNEPVYTKPHYADFEAVDFDTYNGMTCSDIQKRNKERHMNFKAWFHRGGGDGWRKLVDAIARCKFPVAAELHEFLRQRRTDFEVRKPQEYQDAMERVCAPALVLICTCAAVGGLVRADSKCADCVDRLAARCTTLVVDEAGTCADSCIVPVLARNECGGTFKRLVLVGDSKQLPCFTRLRDPLDAPVSLIERVDTVVGSALLTTQYRMFSKLCNIVSNLYYDGRLETGKVDPKGQLKMHTVKGNAETEERGTSLFNAAEARTAIALARDQLVTGGSVAVLAFYKAQVKLIAEALSGTDAVVITVDAAQGQEYDHVVLSCVVNGSKRSFLEDKRRMNVALSRAKLSLDVVMHPSMSKRIPALKTVQTEADANGVSIGRPVAVVGIPVP